MVKELPSDLIGQIQNHTGFPWWNGEAYASFRGYPGTIRKMDKGIGDAIDELYDVIEWLREEKQYKKSDRLRTIVGRLARLRGESLDEPEDLIRSMARKW